MATDSPTPPPGPYRPNPVIPERRERAHSHETLWGVVGFGLMVSIMALFVSMGPCLNQEEVTTKVEHLERRIDNIQDRR